MIPPSTYHPYFKRDILQLSCDGHTMAVPARIKNRYEVTGVLAMGGAGVLFTAVDIKLFNRKVLIKTPKYLSALFLHRNERHRADEIQKARKLIKNEEFAYLLAWLRKAMGTPVYLDLVEDICPRIYGPFRDNDSGEEFTITDDELVMKEPYLVLNYVEGRPISDHHRKKSDDPESFCRRMILSLAKILKVFHETREFNSRQVRMVYMDLKPDNIIYTPDGSYVLIDLGSFSFVMNEETVIGEGVHTPGYCAPEIVTDADKPGEVTAAADIYSLGATAYELLTGKKPDYDGGSNRFDFTLLERMGERWHSLVRKMVAADRKERYETMKQVMDDVPKR